MAYTATYAVADLDDIIVDIVGKFLAAFGDQAAVLAALIVLSIMIAILLHLFGGIGGMIGAFRKFGR